MTLPNMSNAARDVAVLSILIVFQSMRTYARKFSRRKEKYLILKTKE